MNFSPPSIIAKTPHVEFCEKECEKYHGCVAFYRSQYGDCGFHSSQAEPIQHSGFTTYVKNRVVSHENDFMGIAGVCRSPANSKGVLTGEQATMEAKGTFTDIESCRKNCMDDATCTAFEWYATTPGKDGVKCYHTA